MVERAGELRRDAEQDEQLKLEHAGFRQRSHRELGCLAGYRTPDPGGHGASGKRCNRGARLEAFDQSLEDEYSARDRRIEGHGKPGAGSRCQQCAAIRPTPSEQLSGLIREARAHLNDRSLASQRQP